MQLLTCTALLPAVHLAAPRRLLPQILEEMVKSEMGLDMDLSFFDKPAPPTGGDGAASKTLTEKQERLLSGKDIQVPAGVPMDSRYLDSLKSFIGDEASKAVESTEEKEEVRPDRASAPATPFRLRLRLVDPNSKRSPILTLVRTLTLTLTLSCAGGRGVADRGGGGGARPARCPGPC